MADHSPPTVHLDLGDTFGAVLIAVNISSCLYGVTCLQTWYYFRNYEDRWLLRVTVLAILVLETIHAILAMHVVYHFLILNFDHPLALLRDIWSAIFVIPVTTATNTIVHLFYIGRIYKRKRYDQLTTVHTSRTETSKVSHKRDWWTPATLCILKVVQIETGFEVLSIMVTIRATQINNFTLIADNERLMNRVQTMCITALSFTAAVDMICATALSYYLHSNRSGIQRSDTLINKLIIHSINNGALTSLASISVVIVMAPKPKNLLYLAIFEVVGNLYANSLLSTLNSRKSQGQSSLPIKFDSSNQSFGTLRPMSVIRSTGTGDTRIKDISKSPVQVFVETRSDMHVEQDLELLEMKVNGHPGTSS
ncbi:hypothetical protein WG66_016833 [Moniliophthora roreri]|uniref:DUF6534 domain-containing protein n=1 Tax=Moniliophthora roreri TaxID=221103 RepID=A0A0W0G0L8_MONRR|nr:hypothetical protein WG66_016833 [Moniliophthora roreri]